MILLAVLTSFLIVGVSDLITERIPNAITLPLIATGTIAHIIGGTLPEALLGCVLCGGAPLFVGSVCERVAPSVAEKGVGGGDIKAAAAVGAWFGFQGAVVLAAACAVASFVMAARRLRPCARRGVPLGPYLALAVAVVTVLQWG